MVLEPADQRGGEHGFITPQRAAGSSAITPVRSPSGTDGNINQLNCRTGWHWPAPVAQEVRQSGVVGYNNGPPTRFCLVYNFAATMPIKSNFSTEIHQWPASDQNPRIGSKPVQGCGQHCLCRQPNQRRLPALARSESCWRPNQLTSLRCGDRPCAARAAGPAGQRGGRARS